MTYLISFLLSSMGLTILIVWPQDGPGAWLRVNVLKSEGKPSHSKAPLREQLIRERLQVEEREARTRQQNCGGCKGRRISR